MGNGMTQTRIGNVTEEQGVGLIGVGVPHRLVVDLLQVRVDIIIPVVREALDQKVQVPEEEQEVDTIGCLEALVAGHPKMTLDGHCTITGHPHEIQIRMGPCRAILVQSTHHGDQNIMTDTPTRTIILITTPAHGGNQITGHIRVDHHHHRHILVDTTMAVSRSSTMQDGMVTPDDEVDHPWVARMTVILVVDHLHPTGLYGIVEKTSMSTTRPGRLPRVVVAVLLVQSLTHHHSGNTVPGRACHAIADRHRLSNAAVVVELDKSLEHQRRFMFHAQPHCQDSVLRLICRMVHPPVSFEAGPERISTHRGGPPRLRGRIRPKRFYCLYEHPPRPLRTVMGTSHASRKNRLL